MEASASTSVSSSSHQPIASGSTPRAPSPPPPAVLPFAPPPLPKTHLTGSLDLLSHLSLLPSYDTYVRPYFRNPKAPVPLAPGTGAIGGLAALTSEDKGKGRATEGGEKQKGPAQQPKKVKDNVVDLKRMKGDFDDLVEECVVLASDHPSILQPPSSFHRLVVEAPEEGTVPDWTEGLTVFQPEQLEGWGWRLTEGRLPEVDDTSLFVRTPRIQGEKKKKKNKRPRPSDDLLIPANNNNANNNNNNNNNAQSNLQDSNKRRKENGASTPRTPGINVGTPGGGSGSGGGGGGRTPRG